MVLTNAVTLFIAVFLLINCFSLILLDNDKLRLKMQVFIQRICYIFDSVCSSYMTTNRNQLVHLNLNESGQNRKKPGSDSLLNQELRIILKT